MFARQKGRVLLLRALPVKEWRMHRENGWPLASLRAQRREFFFRATPLWEKSSKKGSGPLRRGGGTEGTPSSTPFSSSVRDSQTVAAGSPFAASVSASAAGGSEMSATTEEAAGPSSSPSSSPSAKEHDETPPQDAARPRRPPSSSPPPSYESGIERLFASWQQGVVASIGAVMGIGFILYLLYTPVKEDTVHHTAVVASEALDDIRLKEKALQLSKVIVMSVLQDEAFLKLVAELVRKLLAQEDTKIAVSSLLQSLFEDHYTQEVTKKFVLRIVRDPWIMEQLQVIVKEQALRLFEDKGVKRALSTFLTDSAAKSLSEPELQYETARAVRRSVAAVFNPWS